MFENITTWFDHQKNAFLAWFSKEDKALITFFGPLMLQVKAVALQLGKNDLQVGLKILEDAAFAAVTAAVTAPPGTNVAVAETIFLQILIKEGITAIHNAEAGAIKAAVAILQQQQAAANTTVTSNTP